MLMLSSSSVTVADADCTQEVKTDEPIIPFPDEELTEALSTGHLTADHCVWMNEQGISWEISVEREL